MSTNVLIIPEDFRKDQYVLKPIVEKMMAAAGIPNAKVKVCQELLGGLGEATKWQRLQEIVDRYRGMTRLFLLVVDRDGDAGRRQSLDRLEKKARDFLAEGSIFLGENAWQEVEVWVLAGLQDLPSSWNWQDLRRDPNPKEHYFAPYAARRGLHLAAYDGREKLAREAAGRYSRIRQLCPEDVEQLENRIRRAMTSTR